MTKEYYSGPFDRHQAKSQEKIVSFEKEKEIRQPKPKWSGEVLATKQRDEKPSDLFRWHQEETEKKRAGVLNEIDMNLIRAAASGSRNEWSLPIKNNPEVFKAVIDHQDFDWEALKAAKGCPAKTKVSLKVDDTLLPDPNDPLPF